HATRSVPRATPSNPYPGAGRRSAAGTAILPPVGRRFHARGGPGAPPRRNTPAIGHQQGLPRLRSERVVLLVVRNARADSAAAAVWLHSPMLRRHPDAPAIASPAGLSPHQGGGTPPPSHSENDAGQ